VTAFEDRPQTARGRWAYQALIAIHRLIRRDLAAVERLAAAVLDGLPAAGLHEELEALKSGGTVWQLQLSCLRHCEFVHLHHHVEDMDFFAELEETNPAIRPVVQRLRAEHAAVSDLLDAVDVAAQALSADHSHDARRAVAAALERLRRHLLAHLEYEEQTVASTAQRLAEVPSFG
jgi:Hemerythrin HHE cation binding domain